MKTRRITTFIVGLFLIISPLFFTMTTKVYAATSPSMGDAASFSILAALSMSAAAAGTTISGDLGLSPGLAVSRTGVWTVGGSEYFGTGGLSESAQADALTAYNDLAGQTSDGAWGTDPWSPVPGVWTVALDTTFTGTITLSGDYDDVWVFQVGQDMTFDGSVVLTGNAQACHVFWQVGRDVTIASGSTFVGTLIASRDISLVSGATVNGRVISLNSSITTDGNTISGPTCLAAPTPTPTTTTTTTFDTVYNDTPYCPPLDPGVVAPNIIDSSRVDADSVYISWGPYSGTDDFIVQYGTTQDNLIYSVNVTGFSTTLNSLPVNQPIWVRVAARNECMVGAFEDAVLVGGTTLVGAPRLPNTGRGDGIIDKYWMIVAGSILGIGVFYLTRRVRKNTSE